MPASDFVATILDLNTTSKRKTAAQEEEELREKILHYYLSNATMLALLKEKRRNQKKNGSDWGTGEAEDRAALKEYLAAESLVELKQISAAIGLPVGAKNNFSELDGVVGFFKPIISFMFVLFSAGNGGLIGMMSRFLHDREVAKNPTVDLNEEEKNSSQYSYLFVAAAKEQKKYNAIYREIIKTADNQEQVLNGMLRHVNSSLKTREGSTEAKTRLSEVESVLLGGRIFDDDGVKHLCNAVNRNLDAALKLAGCLPFLEKIEKIKTVKDTFEKLAKKVAERERQLEEDPLTKAKREEFSIFINEHKRKLLHFVIKTQAFAKGETLKPNVRLTGAYRHPDSNAEYDSYFDYWLSKVPSATNPAVELDSANKMIFKQFRLLPTGKRALDELEDLDSYKSAQKKAQDDKLKELNSKTIESSVGVVRSLTAELLGVRRNVKSLAGEIDKLQNKLSGIPANDARAVAISQQIEKISDQNGMLLIKEKNLDNQVKLLQEAIIRNVIDVAKVELELSKARESTGVPTIFNWGLPDKISVEGEDAEAASGREKIMQALKNALQIYDLNSGQNKDLKDMVDESWDKGVSEAIKLQTEFNPQTVKGLFSFLQESSDNLLQQSKRAQESLIKKELPDDESRAGHSAFANRAGGGSSAFHPHV